MARTDVRTRLRASLVSFVLLLPGATFASPPAVDAVRASARAAFEQVAETTPHARAVWRAGQFAPATVTGLAVRVAGRTPQQRALSFVHEHEELVGTRAEHLALKDVRPSLRGVAVRFEQRHGERRVHGREVVITMDQAGVVVGFTSTALPITALGEARVSEARAQQIAQRALPGLVVGDKPTPVIVASAERAVPALSFFAGKPDELRAFRVVVDLNEGGVTSVVEITQR